MLLALCMSLVVIGGGATVITEFSASGLHYGGRCPMERSSGRCTPDICPSPVCHRESEFSPCVCGVVGEAEMARALFLKSLPACQPYEWYAWQMQTLEELMFEYENFACLVGPLACASAAVGGVLLLVQLACCPMLLLGRWGMSKVLLILFASDEELDRVMLSSSAVAQARGGKAGGEDQAEPVKAGFEDCVVSAESTNSGSPEGSNNVIADAGDADDIDDDGTHASAGACRLGGDADAGGWPPKADAQLDAGVPRTAPERPQVPRPGPPPGQGHRRSKASRYTTSRV